MRSDRTFQTKALSSAVQMTLTMATSAMQRILINACLPGFQSILHNIIHAVHQDGGLRLVHGTKENGSIDLFST